MSKLSGLVAIVRNGVVVEVRDLGPTPIDVKPGVVRPLTIVENDTSTGDETATSVSDSIGPNSVTRTITTRDLDASELAARDQAKMNAALAEKGSVVRALAEVMFAEVNKLRIKDGDAAYTMNQFVNALKAKMR